VTIIGGPSSPEIKLNPKHKKNPEIGEKKTVYSSNIFVEQDDVASFDDNEEASSPAEYSCSCIDLATDYPDGLG
jgi:glutamyl-tRNA synthetase